jgi:peroxiredoxin Q/BCP
MPVLQKIVKNKHITALKEGMPAPDFNAKDQEGNPISLKDFRGKKVVLYFYPKDDTSGCTAQSCNLRDNYPALLKKGFAVIGVSADDEKSHRKFITKYNLPFPLIADVDKKVINAYDVWGEKTIFGKTMDGINRTTFLISEDGKIEKVFSEVDTENHTEQILSDIKF